MSVLQPAGDGYILANRLVMAQRYDPRDRPPPPVTSYNSFPIENSRPPRPRLPPQLHFPSEPRYRESFDFDDRMPYPTKDKEIARLRRELAAVNRDRDTVRQYPRPAHPRHHHHHSHHDRRDDHDFIESPRREIMREHEGRLVQLAKPHRSSTLPVHHEYPEQILDLGRRKSRGGSSRAGGSSLYSPSEKPRNGSVISLPIRSHPTSSHPLHYPEDNDSLPYQHSRYNRPRHGSVEYGWERDEPHSRRRSELGWEEESACPSSPATEVSSRRGSRGGREREVREERIIRRLPMAPVASIAPSSPLPPRQSRAGSTIGASTAVGSSESEYDLVEIDSAEVEERPEFENTEGYDVIEVVEDAGKRKKVRRRSIKKKDVLVL